MHMAPKKVLANVKLQIRAGQATPAPPVGTALGQHGVNIMDFCKQYNEATQQFSGQVIPVELTIYEDRSFTFVTKQPPGRRADQAGRRHREGLGRAEPRQGGQALPGAGSRDRREEDGRPQRERRRQRDARSSPARRAAWAWRWRHDDHARQALPRTAPGAVDREHEYMPVEAIKILKAQPDAKFDETIELAFRLGIDTRKADQALRGTVSLPNGTGKSVRVGVFAIGEKAREATEAGADVVGGEELVEQVMKGEIDFDAAVATPDMMAVGRQGRSRARAPRADAEPEDRHGDDGHRQGRRRHQGRQGGVPRRPHRQRPHGRSARSRSASSSCSRTTSPWSTSSSARSRRRRRVATSSRSR